MYVWIRDLEEIFKNNFYVIMVYDYDVFLLINK